MYAFSTALLLLVDLEGLDHNSETIRKLFVVQSGCRSSYRGCKG